MLERLTDDDIRQILTQAIRRISPDVSSPDGTSTAPQASVSRPTDKLADPSSSPPPSSLTLPSSSPLAHSQSAAPAQPEGEEQDVDMEPVPLFSFFPALTPRVMDTIVSLSTGDARTALSLLELLTTSTPSSSASTSATLAMDEDELLATLRRSVSTSYDRTGDDRYDLISALHKSVRGSEPDAALYWLARMLSAGEDPLYIARRMAVCASEDIGLADNHALPLVRISLSSPPRELC